VRIVYVEELKECRIIMQFLGRILKYRGLKKRIDGEVIRFEGCKGFIYDQFMLLNDHLNNQ
jgi:hypothetical protein